MNANLTIDGSDSYFEYGFCLLKPDLVEHHDYEAVSSEMWKYFNSWYSCDFVIARYLIYDHNLGKTLLNLYPSIGRFD